MIMRKLTRLLLAAVPLLAGCGNFWQAQNNSNNGTSFALSADPTSLTVAPGATTGNTSTITVTPSNSFTGTVTLSCAVTSSLTSPTSPGCSLSPTSVSITGTTAETSTLTMTTASGTTLGAYTVTVTGVSGNVAESATVCVEVGTGTCTTTASTSGDFYILNSTNIAGYSIKSGTLTALSGSPTSLPTGVTPSSMAIDPTGHFLYAGTNTGIYLYDIASGTPTLDNTLPPFGDTTSMALQVDSTGQWLLDASNPTAGAPVLFAWPISLINGRSTLGSGISVPQEPLVAGGNVDFGGLAQSPDHKLVAVAVGTATQTFSFSAGSGGNGSTSPFTGTNSKITALGTAVSVAFDTQTRFLYIGETNVPALSSGGLRMIPISSDVVGNEVSGSPYPSGGTGPHAIVASSNGYVYVANWTSGAGDITGFLLDVSTPSLTQQSNPATTGNEPDGMVLDSTGDFVLVVNFQGTTPFDAYTFDSTTAGELDSLTTGSTGTNPVAIAAVP